MALPIFQRMAAAARAKLGEVSTLNGLDIGKVNLQKHVAIDAGIGNTADDNPTVYRDVATFDAATVIRTGDVLVHPDGSYKIDAKLSRSEYRQTYIVVPTVVV